MAFDFKADPKVVEREFGERYFNALKKVYDAAVIKMEDGVLNIDELSEAIGFIASEIKQRRTSEFDNGPVVDFVRSEESDIEPREMTSVDRRYVEVLGKVFEATKAMHESEGLNIDKLSDALEFISSEITQRRTSEFDNGPVADFLAESNELEESSDFTL